VREDYFLSNGKKFKVYKNSKSSFYKLLLLHGYSFNSDVWDLINLPEVLADNFVSAYAFDIPGFPKSRNKQKVTKTEIVDALYDLYIKISTGSKITVLGSSAGAYFASSFAERYPKCVNGLILVGAVNLDIKFDKIKAPIFGIWGSNDNISDPISGKRILEAHNAKVWIIEGASHACYLKDPDEFNNIILSIMDYIKKRNPLPKNENFKKEQQPQPQEPQ